MAEIPDLVSVGPIGAVKHLLQSDRIGIAVAVVQAIAVGDTVAHTCYAQRTFHGFFLAAAPGRRRHQAEHEKQDEVRQNVFDVWLSHNSMFLHSIYPLMCFNADKDSEKICTNGHLFVTSHSIRQKNVWHD